MYCGKEGQTPAAADCPKGCCKGQTSYELSRGKKNDQKTKEKIGVQISRTDRLIKCEPESWAHIYRR